MSSQEVKIRDYFLAEGLDAQLLTSSVRNKLQEEGWTLLGETFADNNMVYQALVKLEVVEIPSE